MRVAMGTVPGTVPEVVRKGTREAYSTAILRPICAVTMIANCLAYHASACGEIRGSFSIVGRSSTW